MDASAMAKLKELVTSRRLKEAELLLSEYLLQTPNDYALLMHMGGVQTSMFNYTKAEQHYKKAITVGKRHSGSAKVQLMRIYSQQSRHIDLISLLKQCLITESKSITLKEQIIQVYLKIFEPKPALIYSRQLIEQIKEVHKEIPSTKETTEEHKKANERNKVLSDAMKQCDLYFMHSQILSKVGRFSDSVIYCKKAISILTAWLNALSSAERRKVLSPQMRSHDPQSKTKQFHERMNRFYGYLGLCYLHVDDIENALSSFKKALNINIKDRIAQTNLSNITQNRGLFDKCIELKGVYQRYSAHKLTDDDKQSDIKAQILEYIQLLVQQNRLLLAQNICDDCLRKKESILGYDCAEFVILYEDILRQKMNQMVKNVSQDVSDAMDAKRNVHGPQRVLKEIESQGNLLQSLPHKIWDIRCKIDSLYKEALKVSDKDVNLCIAYALCLWRIGYNAKGINTITTTLCTSNEGLVTDAKFWLLRGNAFLNEDDNESAMKELQNALKLCTKNSKDEIQTLLLMAVCYNKMNELNKAQEQCERILKMDADHTATLKIYAAILQRRQKYKKSKQIFVNLLKDNAMNVDIATEYIALLIQMKEYEEAKKRLQMILRLNPRNALELMYEFGVISFKMGDMDTAQKTFVSIISQSPKRFDGAFVHLVNILKEQMAHVQQKVTEMDENADDHKTQHKERDALEQRREELVKECDKYLFLWIETDRYNRRPYFMYLEHLWTQNKHRETRDIWKEWIEQMRNEYNEEFEGADEEKQSESKKEKAALLLSDLYQKYGRMLTQNKVVSTRDQPHHDEPEPPLMRRHSLEEDDDEDESSNEEIESYFSKSLQYNESNVDALQGFAAYYISCHEYIHALPFLRKAQALNKALSVTWIQLAQLYERIGERMNTQQMKQMNIVSGLEVLKEGVRYIGSYKYANYKRYTTNMVHICETLIEKLILCGSGAEDMRSAETHCWLILRQLDKLNVTALREISKVSDDRDAIEAFFNDLLDEFPSYCPALVEYAQFLSTAKKDRVQMLSKAQQLLEKVIVITAEDSSHWRYRCVAFYIFGFVKLHQIKAANDEKTKQSLNDEARKMFECAVRADEDNVYARINLAQFLAFRDNDANAALNHLEFAHAKLNENNDPNLIANLCKVLAKKAVIDPDNIDMAMLQRAAKLCRNAFKQYKGHFGLIVARSALINIKKKFNLQELELNEEDAVETDVMQPRTTYGMIGVDIMNMDKLKTKQAQNDDK
eukprot:18058_1